MLNNVILVGRVVEDPKLIITENGYKVANVVLAVQKPFRNEKNETDVDFISIQTWMALAECICDYVGKGSILGFKCRLSTRTVEVNETKIKTIEVIGEKVSFISTCPRAEGNDNKKKTPIVEKIEDEDVMESTVEDADEKKKKNK